MSKVIWTPTDGERREYEFEVEGLLWAEVRAIQKISGATGLMNIGQMIDEVDGAVVPALLWVMRKREEPELTFAALDDLKVGEVDLKFGDDDDLSDPEDPEAPKEESPTGRPPESPPAEPPSVESSPLSLAN